MYYLYNTYATCENTNAFDFHNLTSLIKEVKLWMLFVYTELQSCSRLKCCCSCWLCFLLRFASPMLLCKHQLNPRALLVLCSNMISFRTITPVPPMVHFWLLMLHHVLTATCLATTIMRCKRKQSSEIFCFLSRPFADTFLSPHPKQAMEKSQSRLNATQMVGSHLQG